MSKRVTFKPKRNGAAVEWNVGTKPAHDHKTQIRKRDGAEALNFYLSPSAVAAGYKFDTADPIWVCEDNGTCPSKPSEHDQIVLVDKSDSCVSVADRNTDQVTLRYQLNVKDPNGVSVPIDPIVQNIL